MQIQYLISRPAMLKTLALGIMGFFVMDDGSGSQHLEHPTTTTTTRMIQKFHPPPAGVDNYSQNPTVFGKILRGELPSAILDETDDLLVFRDKRPRAPLHDLIIPKRWIPNVFDLEKTDLPLLYEMKALALQQLELEQPEALARGDYRLVFHVPPFNSVDHLHLHVLAPASKMNLFNRTIKYKGESRSCVNFDMVIKRLEAGRKATPYDRPSEEYKKAKKWISSLVGY